MKFGVPEFLWIAPLAVPALLAFFYWSWRVKQKMIQQFVSARLLPSLTVGVSAARQKFRLALLAAATGCILLALARPQWGFAWEEAHQKGRDIIVAVDTSKSMLAQDVRPNRIEKTKLAVLDLMRLAKTDRLGLVTFAGEAFLQAPLTLDEQAFEQAVEAVYVGIVPVGGTSLSSAIRTALDSFEKGDASHKAIVLFTDGEDHDADADTMAAAKAAADAGVRIFTVGVGTPEGELLRVTDDQGNVSFVKDEDGNVVKSHLNETLLREIATTANGFYLPLQGGNPMETLYTRGLAPLRESEETTRLTRVYQERYHWPLGLAVLCLALEALLPESARARRSEKVPNAAAAARVMAIFLLLLVPLAGRASPSSAYRDYTAGNFNDAFEEYSRLADQKTNDYRLDYDAGAAAYQAKKYEEANKRLTSALNSAGIISDLPAQEHAYYNLGNTLYHLGEPLPDPDKKKKLWEESLANYSRAFKLDTNDLDAKNNLAYVREKLEELKKQQQQQQQNQKNQNDQDQQQNQQNQQNQQSAQNQDQQNQKSQNQQQQQQSAQQKQQQDQQQQADQQKKEEEKRRQEEAKKEQEQRQQQQQASAAQNNGETNSEQTAMAEAQMMTPEEARQLLDEQKDDEKVLIFAPQTNRDSRTQSSPLKDW